MFVYEALKICNKKVLCDTFAAENPESDSSKFSKFIEDLLLITPIISTNDIIINEKTAEGYVSTIVYRKEDIKKYFQNLSYIDLLDNLDIDSMSYDELLPTWKKIEALYDKRKEYKIEEGSDSYPGNVRGFSYEFTDWNKILGYSIPDHITKSYEIIKYLIPILSEMSFFGYDETRKHKELAELESRIKDIDEKKDLPEEEKKEYFKDIDDLFSKYGITDDRTEEEKENDRKESIRKMCLNYIYSYREIKRIFLEL